MCFISVICIHLTTTTTPPSPSPPSTPVKEWNNKIFSKDLKFQLFELKK
jgi:hypothetical protein